MVKITFFTVFMLISSSFSENDFRMDISISSCPSDEIISTKVWWVAGDAHVSTHAKGLEQAISDINSLILDLDYAIQLGDNVNDRHEYGDLFLETMNTIEARDWNYVLGNHDFGDDDEKVLPVTFWGDTVNGIRFLFLSDEVVGRISRNLIMLDEQRNWFFEELENHRDKPIILFSHQPHDEFERLEDVDFDEYDIVAWFHAHKHGWRINGMTEYGFHQLGINAISGHLDPRKSSVLIINECQEGSEFILTFRDHTSQEWIEVDGREEYRFFVE